MKGMLRCERKALDELKLAPAGRAGSPQPKASQPFVAKKTESAAQQHQDAGDCKQLLKLCHPLGLAPEAQHAHGGFPSGTTQFTRAE
jgi:hypothetical protein